MLIWQLSVGILPFDSCSVLPPVVMSSSPPARCSHSGRINVHVHPAKKHGGVLPTVTLLRGEVETCGVSGSSCFVRVNVQVGVVPIAVGQ